MWVVFFCVISHIIILCSMASVNSYLQVEGLTRRVGDRVLFENLSYYAHHSITQNQADET